MCLLGLVELPTRRAFRASVIAFWAVLYGAVMQIVTLLRRDPNELTQDVLRTAPDSLLALLHSTGELGSLAQNVLNALSISELLWIVVFGWALTCTAGMSRRTAGTVATASWLAITVSKIAIATVISATSG